MARKGKTVLARIEPTDPALLSLSTEQLLLHGDRRAAADELFRRRYNKMVKKSEEQA
jgi:hypothetical protein